MNKTFGCVRFIYNYFLDKCKNNNYIKAIDMCLKIKTLFEDYLFKKKLIHIFQEVKSVFIVIIKQN